MMNYEILCQTYQVMRAEPSPGITINTMGGVDCAISTPTLKSAAVNIPFMNNVVRSCNPKKLIIHAMGSRSTLILPTGFLVPMTAFPLL